MPGKPGFRVRSTWPRPAPRCLRPSAKHRPRRLPTACRAWALWIPASAPSGPRRASSARAHGVVPLRRQSDAPQGALARAARRHRSHEHAGQHRQFGLRRTARHQRREVGGRRSSSMARSASRRPPGAAPAGLCRGLCPNGCNKDGAGEVGAIVACGGVAVRPGDIVVADRDGVTIVPLEDAPAVAALAAQQREREHKRLAEIETGVLVRPEIDEYLRKLKIID